MNALNVQVGCILLSGLFVYDIYWVFGTEVMARPPSTGLRALLLFNLPSECVHR